MGSEDVRRAEVRQNQQHKMPSLLPTVATDGVGFLLSLVDARHDMGRRRPVFLSWER